MSDGRSGSARAHPRRPILPMPKVCFIIARPRSGATVFNRMLKTNPKVATYGEILSESNSQSYYSFLQRRAATDPAVLLPSRSTENFKRYIEACKRHTLQKSPSCEMLLLGVKYDQTHLLCDPWWKLGQLPKLFFLMRDAPWKVIDIHRKDAARLCISNRMAMATRVYHANSPTTDMPPSTKIHIDPAELMQDIEATHQAYDAVTRHFAGHSAYKRIYYEEMFDPGGDFSTELIDGISAFLELDNAFDARPKLQKILGADTFSYLENEDEIRQIISGRFEQALPN
jgi:hypothetical protein